MNGGLDPRQALANLGSITASLNPARSLGPAVVTHDFPGYFWIYWIGPGLGALLAAGFYRFFKAFNFDTVNPGADFDEHEARAFVFDEESAGSAAHATRPSIVAQMSDDEAGRSRSIGSLISQ